MKKIVVNIILFIIIMLISSNVLATVNLNASIKSSEEVLIVGQEVEVTFKFNPNKELAQGINSYKATLEYNENVFEQVMQEDFTNLNSWEQLKFNKETGEFVAIKRAGTKEEEDVVKITLKVKTNAEAQETEIKIKDIVTSDGKEDIFVNDTKVQMKIIQEQLTDKENETEISNQDKKTQDNIQDKQATSKIPKTGDTCIGLFILLAIEIFIIIAYISRKKENNIKKEINKRTKMFMIFAITGLLSMQLIGTIFAVSSFASKGELNGDGEINYVDVNLLELHLINQKYLPEDKLENADMNSDGKITVTDLTLLIRKIENKLEYEAILSDVELENLYPNQNEEIL